MLSRFKLELYSSVTYAMFLTCYKCTLDGLFAVFLISYSITLIISMEYWVQIEN